MVDLCKTDSNKKNYLARNSEPKRLAVDLAINSNHPTSCTEFKNRQCVALLEFSIMLIAQDLRAD